jgi:hypothetical protein
MRAFDSTHQRIRVFVLGVPEGWEVAVYDLEKQEWVAGANARHDTLKAAKADALTKAAAVLGKPARKVQWH